MALLRDGVLSTDLVNYGMPCEVMMAELDEEIAAYEAMKQDLEVHSMGQWVLFHDREIVGMYDSFEKAAEDAVRQFGRGPYLIRQVGAPPVTLPASVMYHLG